MYKLQSRNRHFDQTIVESKAPSVPRKTNDLKFSLFFLNNRSYHLKLLINEKYFDRLILVDDENIFSSFMFANYTSRRFFQESIFQKISFVFCKSHKRPFFSGKYFSEKYKISIIHNLEIEITTWIRLTRLTKKSDRSTGWDFVARSLKFRGRKSGALEKGRDS